ncbi:fatty acid desaturase family protein [Flavobacterium reichenbachii]|uniref:Fatty acid desaturase n=1 Tax=Flavobacterium reichenbachii TaxID=362418 RepID=A0A085ZMA2_9FLAO|nr:fatty acid desaturase [Flavobacterium reichenbachii]KFF05566.1 fatty acid desaturase [Flavobacterium reichenbachii]OXB17903.1 fatty acid desaturase [Flavobacterium reichenbachii]
MKELKRPVYLKPGSDDFFKKIRKEVNETVLNNYSLYLFNIIKSLGLVLLFFLLYSCILLFGGNTYLLFFFYILSGVTMIVVFINAFHDAAHGALFKKSKHNKLFLYILELFGSNHWLWMRRHIGLHHAYPNVPDWDIDIKQSGIIRIFPNSPVFDYHKYQHIYMWLIYPFYSLNWIYIRDFRDFFGTKNNYVRKVVENIPKKEIYLLFAAKIINLCYLLFIPMIVLKHPWYIVLGAWFAMHMAASVVGVVALVSTHVDEDAHFPETDQDGNLSATWAMHQMIVTKDFSTESKLANFLYGGFTHHIAHHLFPSVGHTYYPYITPIIRRYAAAYNLPYTSYPFYHAVRSHFRMLKNKGVKENIMMTGEI